MTLRRFRIWRCGPSSPETVGGSSFLVRRPGGNVLVDGPRFSTALVDEIEALGGIAVVLLTHRDDVGAAARYAEELGAEVLIHQRDADAAPFATTIARGDHPVSVADGIEAIPTPGHTAGHLMFLVDDGRCSPGTRWPGPSSGGPPGRAGRLLALLAGAGGVLERFADHRFARVIPTHGAISPEIDPDEMARRLRRLTSTCGSPWPRTEHDSFERR